MSDRVQLSYDEAIAMLPDGDHIHTFVNPGTNVLMGADWSRESVLELLKTGGPELAGDGALSMGHGLVAFREVNAEEKYKRDPIFIQTKEAE